MRIARDGTWYYRGSPINRIPLVKLFASVLRREADGTYWLVTPAERGRVIVEDVPDVDDRTRVQSETLPEGFYRVRATYGFMERTDVPSIVRRCCRDLDVETSDITYYLGRARLVPTGPMPMMRWRKRLFAFMARNSASATDFFSIPADRVVELGAQIEF